MPPSADSKTLAATSLLAAFLTGIPHEGGEADMTFALDQIRSEGTKVSTEVILPTGDTFLVSVEWLGEKSP